MNALDSSAKSSNPIFLASSTLSNCSLYLCAASVIVLNVSASLFVNPNASLACSSAVIAVSVAYCSSNVPLIFFNVSSFLNSALVCWVLVPSTNALFTSISASL